MKTTYEKFIDANNKLVKCFESVHVDKWNKMSAADQGSLCKKESEEVRGYLKNNQVGFAGLIKERLSTARGEHQQ